MLLLVLGGYSANPELAGSYTGEWKSNASGTGGGYHMTLEAAPDGTWKCEAGFILEGAEIKTTTHEIKIQDSKLDVSYDFEIQGASLRSHMTGEWKDGMFRGQYQTIVIGGDGVDEGTWSASRAK